MHRGRAADENAVGERAASAGAVVRGVGACLPKRLVTNDELARQVDTSDEWIAQRTGIRERRWGYLAGRDHERAGDLALPGGDAPPALWPSATFTV